MSIALFSSLPLFFISLWLDWSRQRQETKATRTAVAIGIVSYSGSLLILMSAIVLIMVDRGSA